jgi:hypothetical protein
LASCFTLLGAESSWSKSCLLLYTNTCSHISVEIWLDVQRGPAFISELLTVIPNAHYFKRGTYDLKKVMCVSLSLHHVGKKHTTLFELFFPISFSIADCRICKQTGLHFCCSCTHQSQRTK